MLQKQPIFYHLSFYMRVNHLESNAFLALAITLIGWGGNFIAVRYTTLEIEPWTALSCRLVITALLLSPFIRINKEQWKSIFILMIALVPGHFVFLFLAVSETSSVSSVALFIQLGAPFSVLFAWLLLGDKPGIRRLTGLLIACLGVTTLYYSPDMLDNQKALMLTAISAAGYAIYGVLLEKVKGLSAISIIGGCSILAIPMTVGLAFYNEAPIHAIQSASTTALISIAYTAVISTLVCHSCWAWLMKTYEVSLIAPFSLMVPVIVAFLAFLVFDESIGWRFMISTVLILIGGAFIIRAKAKPKNSNVLAERINEA